MHLLGHGDDVLRLLDAHGSWIVFAVVLLECAGLPLPGESVLLIAAVYAGESHHVSIAGVMTAAIAGAIAGSTGSFALGRTVGFRLLLHYGRLVGLCDRRVKLGLYLFRKHGGAIVFFGRFVALARTWVGLLAGLNQMPWGRFLACNVGGAVIWAIGVGGAAYGLGASVHRWAGIIRVVVLAVAIVALAAGLMFVRRNATRLADEAERALPGPVDHHGPGLDGAGASRRSRPRRV